MRFMSVLGPEATTFFVAAAFVLFGATVVTYDGTDGPSTKMPRVIIDVSK